MQLLLQKGHNEHECYKKLRQQNTHKPKPLQCTAIQKGCHDSVNEITPSKTLHAPVQDRETKVPRITANDKVLKYSYDDVQNDFDHFCLMALYLAQRVRTRHLFVF